MTPDIPADVPVEPPQTTITLAAAPAPAQVIGVDSHGYHYEVIGNTLLAPNLISKQLKASADPKAALDAMNQVYKKAGYVLVALVAKVDDRKVAIHVIEGRVTEKDIVPSLEPYFSGIEERKDITHSSIMRRAAMAEVYSNRQGQRPKINFSPAQAEGGSKITVTEEPIEDAKPWNAGVGFGNYGNRYSSRFLLQSSAALRPGQGVELTANYTHGLPNLSADSQDSRYNGGGLGASVATPWGVYGMGYSKINYRYGKIFAPLFPEGYVTTRNVYGSQLLYADETHRWEINQGYTYTEYNTQVNLNPGSFTITDQNYGFASLGTAFRNEFEVFGSRATISSSFTFSKGISDRSGTFSPAEPGSADPHFTLLAGNLTYAQRLPQQFEGGISMTGQWTNNTLPVNQQWVLGGYGNMTAWFPGVVVGDSGLLTRASLSTPPWEQGFLKLNATAFLEGGYAHLHYVPPVPLNTPDSYFLSDIGIGLSANLKSKTSLNVGAAIPLAKRNVDDAFLHDNRADVYFNLLQLF